MSLSLGLCILFLAITRGDVVRGQVAGPNAVALINGQTMLDCLANFLAASSWTRTPDGTSNSLLIAVGCSVTGNNAAYYRTELLGGNICRLIIANVTMQQAGIYSCYDGASTAYRSLVTVIDPVANVAVHTQSAEVVETDQLNISCSINYNGPASPAPLLRPSPYWTTSPGQIFTSATSHPSTNVVTLIGTVTVQQPTVPIFQCSTVFEITGNTNGYNATAPADNFAVGNTAEIEVQYSPLISTISSEGRNATTSTCEISTVTCHATANPTANYTWIDIEEPSKIIYGQSYGYAEFGRNYSCSATNIIRTTTYTDVKTHEERNEYSTIPPCKGCHNSATNITGETCSNGRLTCTADAYPEPTYHWMHNGLVIENSTGILDVVYEGTYTCVAINVIDEYEFEARIDVEVVKCSVEMTTIPLLASAGENSLWMFLFSLITISCGVFIFPILIKIKNRRGTDLHGSRGDFKRSNPSDLRATKPTSNSEEPHYQDLFKDRAGLRQKQSRQLPGTPKSRGRHFRKKMC